MTPEASVAHGSGDVDTQGEPRVTRNGGGPRLAVLAGALVGGVALIAAGIASWPDNRQQLAVTAGANIAVTSGGSGIAAVNSPGAIASPIDPKLLVVPARADRPRFGAQLYVSRDGGRTWTESQLRLPAGEETAYAPDAAFDGDGNLVVVFATLAGDGNNPSGLWLERSSDGGRSFSAPVRVTGGYAYQPRVVVAPGAGEIHVTYVQATAAVEQVAGGFGPPPNPVMAATSSDRGATFGQPVTVSESDRERVGAAVPAVASDGTLYVLYQDFGEAADDFEGRPGAVHQGRFALVLAQSGDRGRSFRTAGVVDSAVVPTERVAPYAPKSPSLAIDPSDGDLYVAWSDARNGDWDVFLRRSTDRGGSWSAPIRVNDDRLRSGRHQYLPAVAVAPGGRVDVAYLDRRNDEENVLTRVSLATSFDDGRSWATVAVSDTAFDYRIGPGSERQAADIGSRIGIVSGRNGASVVWTDTRSGSLDTDRQDVFFAPVRILPR